MRTNNLIVLKYLTVALAFLLLGIFVVGCSDEAVPNDPSNENQTGVLSKRGPLVHNVSLGGADLCEALGLPTGCDANFSLVANMYADGSISGQWQDTFAGGQEGVNVAIDCMNIIGNFAVIGGVITNGTVGGVDVSGLRAITAVVDNGTSANDPLDQLSFSSLDDNRDCNNLTLDDFVLIDLTHGQVKVW